MEKTTQRRQRKGSKPLCQREVRRERAEDALAVMPSLYVWYCVVKGGAY